jgi:hypothetical protein
MPNKHRNPTLCWHPPAELSAWARAEAERRGVHLKVILDEALEAYRASIIRSTDSAEAITNR